MITGTYERYNTVSLYRDNFLYYSTGTTQKTMMYYKGEFYSQNCFNVQSLNYMYVGSVQ